LLARAGVASRREVERMIADGRVAIGGKVLETPATVLPDLMGVTVDGKPVAAAEPARLFAFHKPSGLITTERDPAGRPPLSRAWPPPLPQGAPRLMPVGRLDFTTEGLLLLTNDGGLKRALELPASGVPRTYRARAFGKVTQAMLDELIEGVTIEGVNYGRIEADLERGAGLNRWIQMTLREGKNREVRRVLEHLGLQVSRLIRIGYGPFALGDLPRGTAVEIAHKEVEKLERALKR
jgi:23S rRNA pseudouridine2605 synthase